MSVDLSHFKFDLFLSYGWAGLKDASEGDRSWVAEFRQALQGKLSSALGRNARIYLDIEQSRNGDLPENLRTAVADSALFLSVISPGSCRSDSWCRKELDWFLSDGAEVLTNRRQLSSLLLWDVEREEWPVPLRSVVPTEFLTSTEPRGPLPQSQLEDSATPAGSLVQTLAIRLKDVLREADNRIAKGVLLASSSPSLESQVQRLATEITKQGGNPVVLRLEREESEPAFRERFGRELKRVGLLVCLVGVAEIATPPGWTLSLEGVEMAEAVERFGVSSSRVIVWPKSNAQSEGWADPQVLKGLGFEYLHTFLCQTLRAHVIEAADRSVAPSPPANEAHSDADAKYVFIQCVKSDLERLKSIRDRFNARGYQVKFPLFEGNPATRDDVDLEFLTRCEAAAVYFGSREDLDAFLVCQRMASRMTRGTRVIPGTVLLDPYSDPVKQNFMFPGFNNYPFDVEDVVTKVTGASA